ncbi:helix-turn-helix transcriptional regulator [Streptomyces alkaliterrae]|uniref:Helix-turn-helix domain-containing protein n=1 Tax=Streptomyces alkaliterrae TaxID=2213162 RepID=A0A5P0YXX2_9ACTN|nr:helix-turn-helix domain-containing protein [Streptomyces alkaliterrae]MBB1262314.1 helix-turn-helix domain-containing protein [Streptomyces alkaliterrae]MQS05136.1 helix-turn-helix domain-containing protein [Streptomyces alkaliterrae]
MSRLLTVAQLTALLGAARRESETEEAGTDLLHSGWYTTEEVAELIGVDSSTLRRWRTARPIQGPPFVRLTSRVILYSVPDVQQWLISRRVDPADGAEAA